MKWLPTDQLLVNRNITSIPLQDQQRTMTYQILCIQDRMIENSWFALQQLTEIYQAKCWICVILGYIAILHKIVGEQSMKCHISCTHTHCDNGNFIFHPVHLYLSNYRIMSSNQLRDHLKDETIYLSIYIYIQRESFVHKMDPIYSQHKFAISDTSIETTCSSECGYSNVFNHIPETQNLIISPF